MNGILQTHEARIAQLEADLRETRNTLERAMHQLSIIEGNTMGAVDTAADLGSDPVLTESDRPVCLAGDMFWGPDADGTVRQGPVALTWNAEHSRWEGGGGEAGSTIYLEMTPVINAPGGSANGHFDEVLRFRSGILSLRDDVQVASDTEHAPLKCVFTTIGGTKYALPLAMLHD